MNGTDLQPVQSGDTALKWSDLKPHQTISLLDMLRFRISDILVDRDTLVTLANVISDMHSKNPQAELRESDSHNILFCINHLRPASEQLELRRSWERMEQMQNAMNSAFSTYDVSRALHDLWDLLQAISFDLREKTFMYIPPEDAKYFDQSDLFGIKPAFPTANEEIKFAGNCYATGLYTACVFHLMRAVEIGAKVMVRALKAQQYLFNTKLNGKPVLKPVELCDWKLLFDGLEKSLNVLESNMGQSLKRKETFEYYHHAVYAFKNFRHAWRNKVSHSRHVYQPGETKDIIDFTRQFMIHLAQRLKETKSDKIST